MDEAERTVLNEQKGIKFVLLFFLLTCFVFFFTLGNVINVLFPFFLEMEPERTDEAERTVLNEQKGKFVLLFLFLLFFTFFYFRERY